MKRREFLECAALIVGGMSAAQTGLALTQEQKVYLASAPDYISRAANLFSVEQRFLIDNFCEIIIPQTDTPGAIRAGVPKFIELMVAEWLNDEERSIFLTGLESIPVYTAKEFGKGITDLSQAEMLEILESLEDAASNDPWYGFGNMEGAFGEKHKSPFICQLKELTIWGFFTSEVGSKQVLRYNPMPMEFKGDIPLEDEDSAWAGKML